MCGFVGWFGVAFGPQNVRAEIYREVRTLASGVAQAIADRIDPKPDRYFVMNGNVIRAQLGSTDLLPHEFTASVQNGFPGSPADMTFLNANAEEALSRLSSTLRAPRRFDGAGWSALVQIFGGVPGAVEDASATFRRTGALGPEAAGGFLLLATRTERAPATDVWLLHFDEDFRPLEYTVEGDREAAGGDIPGVERYPGSRRTLTLSEISPTGRVHNVTYLGGGSVDDHVRHYRDVFTRMGLHEAPSTTHREGVVLRFRDAEREATVFVARAPVSGDGVQDLIQISTYH